MAAQQQQTFIPPQVLSQFAEAVDCSLEEAGPLLEQRVREIVGIYESNGMMAFWGSADLIAVQVAISNQLMTALDTNTAIRDVETYERVYSNLPKWFAEWIGATKRTAFNESVEAVVASLDEQGITALRGALTVACQFLKSKEPGSTTDEKQLFDITMAANAALPEAAVKSGRGDTWSQLRLGLVLSTITGNHLAGVTNSSAPPASPAAAVVDEEKDEPVKLLDAINRHQ